MQKGVGNTDLSMFGDETRIVLLKKAADEFLAVKNYHEAVMAYRLIRDKSKLNKLGDYFLKSGLLSSALSSYESADNEVMVRFIKQNFDDKIYKDKLYV